MCHTPTSEQRVETILTQVPECKELVFELDDLLDNGDKVTNSLGKSGLGMIVE